MQAFYLQTQNMTVGYDKPLIEHIDLRLRRGEIMTLIGPNGAGKSTILKTIVRQLRLLGGVVELDGQSLASLDNKTVAQKMSVLMTERHQPELMTCRDVAAAGRYPYTGRMGVLSQADRAKVDEALAQVRAADLADRPFSAISDGQRQRVLLARALCQEPEILVLDEPTSFLDIRHKLELLSTLKELVAERQLAVVLSLHELDLAQRVSDLVVCVHNNSIEKVGPPEEVFTEDYIAQLYELPPGIYSAAYGSLELPGIPGLSADGGRGVYPSPGRAENLRDRPLLLSRIRPGQRRQPALTERSAGDGQARCIFRGGFPWPLNTIFTPTANSSAVGTRRGPARRWPHPGRCKNYSPASGRRRSPCGRPRV